MKRLLTENLGWKLLSLALAVMLWLAVMGEPEIVTTTSVPLEFRNLPQDLEMSFDALEKVHLELRGPSAKLTAADLARCAVVLDLADVQAAGERTLMIQQWNVKLPAGVTLVRAVPSQVRVRFDRRLRREVPVLVRFSGPPPKGYRLVHHEVTPPKLWIAGPERHVERIDSALTDPVDLSAVVSTAEFRVYTYLNDPQVRFESTPQVTVKVRVENEGATPTK